MKVCFHIGYPRTGTTFLQANIFPFHSEINYLGPKHHYYGDQPEVKVYLNKEILKKITNSFQYDDVFKLKISEITDKMQDILDTTQFDEKKLNLISTEKYLTYGYKSFKEIYLIKKYLDAVIKNVDFKIFFMVRNQYDIIFSQFHHGHFLLGKQLGITKFKELIYSINDINKSKKETLEFFKLYDYFQIFDELKKIFGKENIEILEYENFKNDPQDFFLNLSKIFKIDSSETKILSSRNKLNFLNVSNKNQILIENSITIFLGNLFKKMGLKKFIPKFLKEKIKSLLFSKIALKEYNQDELRSIVENYYKNSNINFKKETGVKFLST